MDNKITSTVTIKGMACGMCVKHVEKALLNVNGVEAVNIDLKKANAEITFDSSCCSLETLKQAVSDAGYEMVL